MPRTVAQLPEHPPAPAQTEVDVQAQSPYRRVGDLTIDLVRKQVVGGSREFRLPKLSFDLLAALVEAAPEPVSIDSLMSRVWPGLVVTPETVVQRVKLLRAALGDDSRRPRYVEGLRGRGYRLVAQVSTVPCAELGRESPAAAEPLVEAAAEPAAAESSAAPSRGVQGPRSRRAVPARAVAVIAALLLVVVAAGGFGLARFVTSDAPPPPAPRIAVLPFESLSPNPGDALLADGMQDELIDALAERAPSLGVIARTTMMTYRGRPKVAASTVGRELGAAYVVAATLRRDTGGMRMTLELVDAKTDALLWSHAYERDLAEMSSLRSEAAADLAMHLALAGTPADAPARAAATRNPDAYDQYLQALAALQAASGIYAPCCGAPSLEDLQTIETRLTRAVALDPDFAEAYALRMVVRIAVHLWNFDVSDAQLRRIREDLAAAEKLAPRAAKTLEARAYYEAWIEGHYARALAILADAQKAGLAAPPLWAADLLVREQHVDEALRVFRRALELDPKNPIVSYSYASELTLLHRPAEALRAIDFGLAQSPDDPALQRWKSTAAFEFTGDRTRLRPLAEAAAAAGPAIRAADSGLLLAWAFHLLTSADETAKIPALLDSVGAPTVRAAFGGVGREPIAAYRGWTCLLLGDRQGAAEQGRRVLEFLAAGEETKHDRYFRQLLAAEARLFMGDDRAAVAQARAAAAAPQPPGLAQSYFNHWTVAIYAWGGAESDAVDLLEKFTSVWPAAEPAVVARSPLYTVPLARNARFQRLMSRLEAEMSAIRPD
ncbi:MAG TPA: winged helix-turn-helix domain-containing protein [Gammaproteobacteria bacterium]|nr:winged helix-turn-helix domain-containing protein [Gammaproteobacteria bacterium]